MSKYLDSVGYFNVNWDTSLHTDASNKGISAVLTQENPNNPSEKRIILCISRCLNEHEKKYCQLELEALAPVWAMERLNRYLLGKPFKLYIDNKAIKLILDNPLTVPSDEVDPNVLLLVRLIDEELAELLSTEPLSLVVAIFNVDPENKKMSPLKDPPLRLSN